MTPNTEHVRQQLLADLRMLERIADEVRLNVHLAGMEARTKWTELEQELFDLRIQFAKDVHEVPRAALAELIRGMRQLRDRVQHVTQRPS